MSFISSLFFPKPKFAPADLSVLKCDIHSHLIPGIDDGAQVMEESLQIIDYFKSQGYQKLITTPHVMSDYYKNTPEIILSGLAKLREAVKNAGIEIELEAAAEYYLDFDFEQKIDQNKLLTFGDKYVLFELGFLSPSDSLNNAIFLMQTNGYKPVLAHPERYTYWYRDFNKYYELKEKGVLFQMNINSLTGHYSLDTKKIAERMVDEDMIELLGSDCHNMNHVNLLEQCRKEKYLNKILKKENLLNSQL
ncbi:MAG: capsular biosynthesis protein [Bacteroidetes bacterium]|nr:capsular biosynthesis protein [Bacteroidota bacterium]HET6245698.1 CpsB/CapC family capsule biosynthesis tyrosine phosphatase [Bacteroidia bacterium]